MTTKKARAPHDKAARRETLLAAAGELFSEAPYGGVTVSKVAQRAGLAKGTVYLYFDTKEELFLQVYIDQLEAWLGSLDRQLDAEDGPLGSRELADLLATSLTERPLLRRLVAVLHGVLEQNISPATAEAFKKGLLERIAHSGRLLEARLPNFRPGDGIRFLFLLNALVVGLSASASPPPVIAKVLEQPELEALRIDFYTELNSALAALLRGWSPAEDLCNEF